MKKDLLIVAVLMNRQTVNITVNEDEAPELFPGLKDAIEMGEMFTISDYSYSAATMRYCGEPLEDLNTNLIVGLRFHTLNMTRSKVSNNVKENNHGTK